MKQYEYIVKVRGGINMENRIRTALKQVCGSRKEDIAVTPSLDSSCFPDIEVHGLAKRCEQDIGNEEFIDFHFLDDFSAACNTDNPRLLAERLYQIFLRQFSVEYSKEITKNLLEDVLFDLGISLPKSNDDLEQLRQKIEIMLQSERYPDEYIRKVLINESCMSRKPWPVREIPDAVLRILYGICEPVNRDVLADMEAHGKAVPLA